MSSITLREYFDSHPDDMWCIGENSKVDFSSTLGSKKTVLWYCPHYQCYYRQSIQSKFRQGKISSCPVCSGRILIPGVNDFATLYPEMSNEWDESNKKKPNEVTQRSGYKAKWVCSSCGKKWNAHVHNRASSAYSSGCSSCNSKKRGDTERGKSFSDLKSLKSIPDAVLEYHVDQPGNEFSSANSTKRVLWRCSKGDSDHEWEESPRNMMKHQSCPVCSGSTMQGKMPHRGRRSLLSFINDSDNSATASLCSFIDTSQVSYQSAMNVTRVCEKGHISSQAAYVMTQGGYLHSCPKCISSNSRPEEEVLDFVRSIYQGEVESHNRSLLNGREVDIYIPQKRIAIEFNGLYWHSSAIDSKENRKRHYDKWRECKDKGIRLITIWEDEWRDKQDIIKLMLERKLGLDSSPSVYARNCDVVEIGVHQARSFCDQNHIQGFTPGSFYIGLIEKGTQNLVAVSILKNGHIKGRKVMYITRYCTSRKVPGGAGKLLKETEKIAHSNSCDSIVTIADHCVSDGSLYKSLGFDQGEEIRPDYKYVVSGTRVHKFNYRKERFEKDPNLKFSIGLSETELSVLNSIPRIYDCGKTRYMKHLTHERQWEM